MGTLGSSLTTTPSSGPTREVQGRWGRSLEVDGGDLGGGEGEGRVGAICILFSPATCLFWVFPHNFLIRAKMHKLKKETKGRTNDPILTHPVWAHQGDGPSGGGWGGGFSFGWMDLGAKKKRQGSSSRPCGSSSVAVGWGMRPSWGIMSSSSPRSWGLRPSIIICSTR